MLIQPGTPKPPIDELVTDSILLHFSGGYAVVTQRPHAAGVQVQPAISYAITDAKAEALRIVDDVAVVVQRDVIKGVFTKLLDVKTAADVEAIVLAEGIVPGPKAAEKDAEHDAKAVAATATEDVLAKAEAVK